jgi:NAD(P)-dependent dehydrogenase (short-subunit alcohol dehydrogenase family)
MKKLKIFITGASSGIGLTTALHLLSRGHFVVGSSRNPDGLSKDALKEKVLRDHTRFRVKKDGQIDKVRTNLPPELQDLDGLLERLKFIHLDPAVEGSPGQAKKELLSLTGGELDILFLNAGMSIFGPIEETEDEFLRQQFEANVFQHLLVLRELLPVMRERRKGKIIFTSSLGALVTIPFESHYSATKVALERLAEGLAMELKPFSIQVAVVEPGDINTSFNLTTAQVLKKAAVGAKSDDLPHLLGSFPLPKSSPYYFRARNSWNYIFRSLLLKPSPSVVARLMIKLAEKERIAFRYRAGDPLQTVPVWIGTKILPQKVLQWAVEKMYELDRK